MQAILCPAAPAVKPAPFAVMTDAEFSAWCARQWTPTTSPAPCEFASDDTSYVPTLRELWEESGRTIGLTGALANVRSTFPDASYADIQEAGVAFTMACVAANRIHAKNVGFDLGADGKSCVRPASVHRRYDREFVAGWEDGVIERAAREREMAAYFQQLDWEHEYEMEQREIEKINREVGGWDRAGNLSLV